MATDLEKLQGNWNVTSLESDGRRMDGASFAGAKIAIAGKRFTTVGMGETYEGEVRLHPGTRPKAFDLLFTAGPLKGNRNLGIYQLNGDSWTICLDTHGSKRPAKFATAGAPGVVLETLERALDREDTTARRATPLRKPPRRASTSMRPVVASRNVGAAAPTPLEGEWTMVSAVFNGKALGSDMVKWCRRITRGDVTTVVAGPRTMLKARFDLDLSVQPGVIDYTNLEGEHAGKAQAGIFDLDGDVLQICMAPPGERRPAAFSSTAGDRRSYTTWRRAAD